MGGKAEVLHPIIGGSETPYGPEKYRVNFDVLTISGDSATGTTRTGSALSNRLGIRHINAGDIVRKLKNVGSQEESGYIERTVDEDLSIDQMIVEEIVNSATEGPVVIEARLAGYFGTLTDMSHAAELKIERILLLASPLERAVRRQKDNPDLNLREIMARQKERKEGDLREFREVHPELASIDPMKRSAEVNGRWIYDMAIVTDGLTEEEVVQAIMDELENKGDIEKTQA